MSDRFAVNFPLGRSYLPAAPTAPMSIHEPARELPISVDCDVAVFGGGPAGVFAAVAAARQGANVVLVERYGFLGGMATAGWVIILHTCSSPDGKQRVIGSLPQEFLDRLGAMDAVRPSTMGHAFDGEAAKFVFDDMLLGSGAKLMLHTMLVDVVRDGRQIQAAIVENKSGRSAIRARTYIDCTGDADLVRRSGAEMMVGNGRGDYQPPSLCFRVEGAADKPTPLAGVHVELVKTPMDYNGEIYPCHLWGSKDVWSDSGWLLCGTRVPGVNCAEAADFTRAEIEARYQLRWIMKHLRDIPGWQKARLVQAATQIGVRETYRIIADATVTRTDLLEGRRFADVIAQGTYPVDIHTPGGGGIRFDYITGKGREIDTARNVRWYRWDNQPKDAPLRDTPCWQVPYGCLVPRALENVLAAGRCIGADHEAAGATRVMINCMQFGQAAGTAATMRGPAGVRDISVAALQRKLIDAGAPLILSQQG